MISYSRLDGRWLHLSEDDWAGLDSECECALTLTRCVPEEAPWLELGRSTQTFVAGSTVTFKSGHLYARPADVDSGA